MRTNPDQNLLIRKLIAVVMVVVFVSGGCQMNARKNRDAMLLSVPKPPPDDIVAGTLLTANLDTEETVGPTRDIIHAPLSVQAPLTLQAAIESALRNSKVARVSEGGSIDASRDTFYDIEVSNARIREALASFDTNFTADILAGNSNNAPNAFFGPGLAQPLERDELSYQMGLEKRTLTGADAAVRYNPDPGYLFIPNSTSSSFNPTLVSELEFSINQPLLRGAGRSINAAPITIRQIEADQSTWLFKKTMMASVRSVVEAYWDLYAARQTLTATQEVLPLLEEVVRLQKAAFKAKWVIAADVAKAESELYGYRQEFVAAQSQVVAAELRLRNLTGVSPQLDQPIDLETQPLTAPIDYAHTVVMEQAMSNNPDLAQRQLDIALRKLELFVAENGVKPKFDLVALYRMNGVGEDLGDAIKQMSTAEFADWEVGASFSVPIGRRQARAVSTAAQDRLAKEQQLLQQTSLTVSYDLAEELRRIEFAQLELEEVKQRLEAANTWVEGARLRYQNPNPDDESATALLEILNDYLRAIRNRTDSVAEQASIVARYNTSLIRLEEIKGTLLSFFAIAFPGDPCCQIESLPVETLPQPRNYQPQDQRPLYDERTPVLPDHTNSDQIDSGRIERDQLNESSQLQMKQIKPSPEPTDQPQLQQSLGKQSLVAQFLAKQTSESPSASSEKENGRQMIPKPEEFKRDVEPESKRTAKKRIKFFSRMKKDVPVEIGPYPIERYPIDRYRVYR